MIRVRGIVGHKAWEDAWAVLDGAWDEARAGEDAKIQDEVRAQEEVWVGEWDGEMVNSQNRGVTVVREI